jgi:hypothetical protein
MKLAPALWLGVFVACLAGCSGPSQKLGSVTVTVDACDAIADAPQYQPVKLEVRQGNTLVTTRTVQSAQPYLLRLPVGQYVFTAPTEHDRPVSTTLRGSSVAYVDLISTCG